MITDNSKNIRAAYKVSLLTLLLLLIGSLIWYKQRMLFVDPCWITYQNINTGHFNIAEHRYGAAITQWVPLAGSWLNMSLKTILIAYSVSFYVFYLAVALIVGFGYRQYWLGILLPCYFTFFVSDVYFWPNNEVHQGVAWMTLLMGFFLHHYNRGRFNVLALLLLPVLTFLAVFSHFIVIVPLSYLCFYFLIEHRKALNRKTIFPVLFLIGCIALLFGVKYWLGTSHSWYDVGKLEPLRKMGIDTILASFNSDHAATIVPLFISNYWIVLLVLLASITTLLRSRKYLLVALLLGYTLGYFSLICLTYPEGYGRERLFYMESEWMALAIIISVPCLLHLLPRLSAKAGTLLLAGIFLVRLCYIGYAYPLFNQRVLLVERITDKLKAQNINKAVVQLSQKQSDDLFIYDWGLPVESIMASQLKGYTPAITFKVVHEPIVSLPQPDSFYSCFNTLAIKELDKRYFNVAANSQYTILSAQQLDSIVRHSGSAR